MDSGEDKAFGLKPSKSSAPSLISSVSVLGSVMWMQSSEFSNSLLMTIGGSEIMSLNLLGMQSYLGIPSTLNIDLILWHTQLMLNHGLNHGLFLSLFKLIPYHIL